MIRSLSILVSELSKRMYAGIPIHAAKIPALIYSASKTHLKYVVVNNGQVPYKAIKQFQNFSCNHADTKSTQSKIEKGIVDHSMMDSIK